MSSILSQIKAARLKHGLSQAALGEKLGVPQSHVSKIEQGISDPRLSTISDLAQMLDQELVLVPRQMLPALRAFLHGEGEEERRFQPDRNDPERDDA